VQTDHDPLLLAVYGTLRRGGGGRAAAGLGDGDLVDLGPCRLPGALVDLGAYPGLVDADGAEGGGSQGVTAELVRCADAAVLARLDAFEGFDPALPISPLFVRRPVTLLNPAATTVWAYRFAGDPSAYPRLPGGDWMAARE
jgi:gamma-glutamylcyclotransferase (GGCT)/AIG2-like uncharacterized protein YtfP